MDKRTQTGLLLDCYGALLTERQRVLLLMHYDEDLSLAEIAEREGISRQAVRDALMRGEAQLNEYETKLGFMKRDMEITRSIRTLMDQDTDPAAADWRKTLARLLERIEGGNGI